MTQIFDLFGDPVPAGHGCRGRPEHVPTQENRRRVNMLLAFGWSNQRIAASVGVTIKTLRKHYSHELKGRDEARDKLTSRLALKVWEQVEAGNVAAMKEFWKVLERNDFAVYGQSARPQGAGQAERKARTVPLGKKEAALAAAHQPDTGSSLGLLIARRQSEVN